MRSAGLVLAVTLTSSLVGPPRAARADDWKVVKDEQGVQVSSRKVEGSAIVEVRAVTVLDFPAERIYAVLKDIESYPEIMPPTAVARRIEAPGPARAGVLFYYMEIDPPVIARRFYCMRADLTRLPDGVLRSEWRTANELCPAPSSRRVRMEQNHGSWTLRPLGEARTEVTYQAHSDPGGAVPTWMVNRAVIGSTPKIIASLRKAAAMPKYAAPATMP